MSKEGHVKLKRWCEYGEDREDCQDLTDNQVYYDSINKQFKARFYCPVCGDFVGVFCYSTDRMHVLLHELLSDEIYCIDCFERECLDVIDFNLVDDDGYDLIGGVLCTC